MVVGEFTQETDLLVVGGGPAGYSAAFRAAELGVPTVIVDPRDSLGGICLHQGCVPSKTLLHLAETIALSGRAKEAGIDFGQPKIDPAAVRSWVRQAVGKLAAGLESTAQKHGVERIQGRAHFEDSRHAALLDSNVPRIRFRRALIATGSLPKAHAELPFDGTHILAPHEAMELDSIPKSLLIVGGDYLALELATILAALGSSISLICDAAAWLPEADSDLVRPLVRTLSKRLKAMELNTSAALAEPPTPEGGAAIRITSSGGAAGQGAAGPRGTITRFDRVIVTAGHIGNTRGLQLEKTGAKVDEHEFLIIDAQMRTGDPRIFAAGDVTGHPLLADKALAQGRAAAEAIAGHYSVLEPRAIPTAIFTDPQLAWCGLTEAEAQRSEIACAAAKLPWGASGRATGMGRGGDGLTKLVYDPDSQLVLGVGLVGPQACEMIAEAALALEMGATLTDLAETIHPHPTMSELLADAARQALAAAPTEARP